VRESYVVGNVTGEGEEEVGGLVGVRNETRFRDSAVVEPYWDINPTGQPDSDGGGGLTTEEIIGGSATENMFGSDFEEDWRTVTKPNEYPVLS